MTEIPRDAVELLEAPPVPPAAAAQAWEPGEDSAITSLQRAMLGPLNTAHYLPVFARFEAVDRAGPGWNWAASLCTINWMVFRRLWGPLLAYLGALAAGALLVLGIGRSVLHLSPSEEISLLVAMGTIAFLVPGGLGDAWLYRHYRRRSAEALAAAPTLQEACALLARQAASRQRLLGVVVGNVVLAAAALTGWSMVPATAGGDATLAQRDAPRRATGPVETAAPPSPPAITGATAAAGARPHSDTPPGADAPGAAPTIPIVPAAPVSAPAAAEAVPAPMPASSPASEAARAGSAPPDWYPRPEAMRPYVTRYRPLPAAPVAVAQAADPAAGAVPLPARAADAASRPIAAKRPVAAAAPAQATSAAAARAPDTPASGRYVINIGLFGDPANTQRVLAALRGAQVRLLVEELDMPNGHRTRVRSGPYATKAQADAAAARIRGLKLDAVVVRQ